MSELDLLEIGLYLATGSVAGLLAGLLGVGGGLFIVPVLLFILPFVGVETSHLMTICVATSLCTIVVTSMSSIIAHQKHQAILWSLFWKLLPGISLGALSGAFIADMVSQQALKMLFGISVILIAIKMLAPLRPRAAAELPGMFALMSIGAVIGNISAMIGIGGGALIVPALNYWKIPMANAVATSSACGLPLAIVGTIGFMFTGMDQSDLPAYSSGYVYWPAVLGIISSSIVFAPVGARFAHRISEPLLSGIFAVFLLIVGAKVLTS